MDHLASGIAGNASIHFPMCQNRNDLIPTPGAKPTSFEKAFVAMEAALPNSRNLILNDIRPSGGPDERIWSFHCLDNDDKHNLIIPTIVLAEVRNINLDVIDGLKVKNFTVHNDAARSFNLLRSETRFTMNFNFEITVNLIFGKGRPLQDNPVVPMLNQICRVVTKTIDKFETLIQNTP